MGKTIEVVFQGTVARVVVERVGRDGLYGSTGRIGLDAKGRECSTALLTRDGRHALGPGSTAGLYLDQYGDVANNEDLVPTDAKGNALEKLPPTVSSPQELSGPVPVEAILEHVVTDVYQVDDSDLDSALAASLAQGDIYQMPFRPRASFKDSRAFLLANEHGAFLLVAEPARFEFVGADSQAVFEEDEEEERDNLDFEMM